MRLRGDQSDEPERLAKSFRFEVVEAPKREPRDLSDLSAAETDELRRTLNRNRELIREQLRRTR